MRLSFLEKELSMGILDSYFCSQNDPVQLAMFCAECRYASQFEARRASKRAGIEDRSLSRAFVADLVMGTVNEGHSKPLELR